MTQGMIQCAFGGGWLMGAIAVLILLLLAVSLGVLLLSSNRLHNTDRQRDALPPSSMAASAVKEGRRR